MEVLIKLLLVHLLFDFVFQSNKTVLLKKQYSWKGRQMHWHVLRHTVFSYLVLAQWSAWWVMPFIYITHLLIDNWKTRQRDSLVNFLVDQGMHFAVLLTIAILLTYPHTPWIETTKGIWQNPAVWLVTTGYILLLFPSAIFMQFATRHWRNDLIKHNAPLMKDSLKQAGKWIGMLERTVIFTCILTGRYEGIGILIAAKSILRFNDLKGEHSQRQTEYILIGTLLSFLMAIGIGIGLKILLKGQVPG